mmetsp:Transcript_64042/g.151516  ORF Transcript_64042/g.151516 Transcript_64042/m.151516 type:complete len:253 (+) Transcript_64042:105-863(+)
MISALSLHVAAHVHIVLLVQREVELVAEQRILDVHDLTGDISHVRLKVGGSGALATRWGREGAVMVEVAVGEPAVEQLTLLAETAADGAPGTELAVLGLLEGALGGALLGLLVGLAAEVLHIVLGVLAGATTLLLLLGSLLGLATTVARTATLRHSRFLLGAERGFLVGLDPAGHAGVGVELLGKLARCAATEIHEIHHREEALGDASVELPSRSVLAELGGREPAGDGVRVGTHGFGSRHRARLERERRVR